jgi:hypothetical protein
MSFSIRGLLIGVTVLAVAFGILRLLNPYLSQLYLLLVAIFVFCQPIGALYRTGQQQAFWLGSSLCGYGFIILAIAKFNILPRMLALVAANWMTNRGAIASDGLYMNVYSPIFEALFLLGGSALGGIVSAYILYQEPQCRDDSLKRN